MRVVRSGAMSARPRHSGRGGVPPDHLLADGGGAADHRREHRPGDAALAADRARDARAAWSRTATSRATRTARCASPPSGLEQAEAIVGRHRLIERFLTDVVGIAWDDVHEEAEKLEHAMSPAFEQWMISAVGDAKTCPHGHPIEPGTRVPGVPLADVEVGAEVEVLRFENEAEDLLHYLKDVGHGAGPEGHARRVERRRGRAAGRTATPCRSRAASPRRSRCARTRHRRRAPRFPSSWCSGRDRTAADAAAASAAARAP